MRYDNGSIVILYIILLLLLLQLFSLQTNSCRKISSIIEWLFNTFRNLSNIYFYFYWRWFINHKRNCNSSSDGRQFPIWDLQWHAVGFGKDNFIPLSFLLRCIVCLLQMLVQIVCCSLWLQYAYDFSHTLLKRTNNQVSSSIFGIVFPLGSHSFI